MLKLNSQHPRATEGDKITVCLIKSIQVHMQGGGGCCGRGRVWAVMDEIVAKVRRCFPQRALLTISPVTATDLQGNSFFLLYSTNSYKQFGYGRSVLKENFLFDKYSLLLFLCFFERKLPLLFEGIKRTLVKTRISH